MDADAERTLLVHAATELTTGGRVPLEAMAIETGLSIEDVTTAVEQLAAQGLVEVEDGAVVRVTSEGLADTEADG